MKAQLKIFCWALAAALLFLSCRSVQETAVRRSVPPITENRLLRNIADSSLDYSTIYGKRLEITLVNNEGKSSSFKASLKMKRDSFIQINLVAALGIEVGRVLLTPDSIRFMDSYHKRYLLTDYGYFYDKYDIRIDYAFIQNLLTNRFFQLDLGGEYGRNRKFRLDRVDYAYELSTVEERALGRKLKKIYKKRRKNKDYILILQKLRIDPMTFRPLALSIEDMEDFSGLRVEYEDFRDFGGRLFPERIIFNVFSEPFKSTLSVKWQKVDFDVPVKGGFKISSKYKRID